MSSSRAPDRVTAFLFLAVLAVTSVFLCLAFGPQPAHAQCWGGSCGGGPSPLAPAVHDAPPFMQGATPFVQGATPFVQEPPLPTPWTMTAWGQKWVPVPGTGGDQEALLLNGRQAGIWSYSRNGYFALLPDGSWGERRTVTPDGWKAKAMTGKGEPAAKAGCGCPKCDGGCSCRETGRPCGDGGCPCVADEPLCGVESDKLGGRTRYLLNGVEVPRHEAALALGRRSVGADGRIPDDSGKFRLTVIGAEADRKRVLADAEAFPPELKAKLVCQAYPPDSPLVAERKFVTSGSPTVYLQAPSGRVLGRNLDGKYRGAEQLVKAVDDKVKNYDPSKDPDLVPVVIPVPAPLVPLIPQPAPANSFASKDVLVGGGILLALFLLVRKNGDK